MQRDILMRHRRDVKCRPLEDQNTRVDSTTSGPSASNESLTTLNPILQTPESRESIAPVMRNSEQQARSSVDDQDPQARAFPFAPSNQATWMGPNPVTSTSPIPEQSSGINVYQLGPDGIDFGGFDHDVLQHIDTGLREEISAMDFQSYHQPHLLHRTCAKFPGEDIIQPQSIQNLWFTSIDESWVQTTVQKRNHDHMHASQCLSPESMGTTLSEDDRLNMCDRLQIFTYEPCVPSTDLLNVGLRLYFAKVHPIFPLVHASTFQPCRENADLVIAMCAIGGLFTGSEQGLQQGIYLFQRVHKATLHNWEQLLARGRKELIIAIQSAAIAQLFGLLSGSPNLLLTIDAFHGPPIAWSRYLRLFSRPETTHIDPDISGHELDKLWHDWARNEEIGRVAHGLFIMDAELAGILHHETIQSWSAYKVPFACSEASFAAANALDWKSVYSDELKRRHSILPNGEIQRSPPLPSLPSLVSQTSALTNYVCLESIGSQVLLRHSYGGCENGSTAAINESFDALHHRVSKCCTKSRHVHNAQDPFQLHALQSLIYMTALADFNLLERVVGRDGLELTNDEIASVTSWASSVDGKRCILHAILIKKAVEARSVMLEPALHIPRAMFWAGLALFCYIRFGATNGSLPTLQHPTTLDFPEFSSMGVNLATLAPELNFASQNSVLPLKLILFSIIDFLQNTGHWRISKRFAAILSTLASSAFGSTM